MTLYSKSGQYPTRLPFRIKLSDGRTRTDSSSFTEEEILDAGYVSVPDKPVATPWQTVLWKGTEWQVDDQSVETLKQQKMAEIDAYRDSLIYSEKTVQLSDGRTVPVDVRRDKPDIQNLTNIVQKASLKIIRGESSTQLFKAADNLVYELTPEQAVELGESVFAQIESIYAESWVRKAELEALTTAQQVYEFTSYWSKI